MAFSGADGNPSMSAPDVDLTALIPCLSYPLGKQAREEIAGVYLRARHHEPPPPADGRRLPFLPQRCCRQRPAEVEAMVA